MTPKEIDTIEAGRELDALIAEHLFDYSWLVLKENVSGIMLVDPSRTKTWMEMGALKVTDSKEERINNWDAFTTYYSTTWDGAGLVIDHLHRQGWVLKMYLTQDDYWINECIVTKPEWRDDLGIYARDKNLFVAVCRAALKAVLQGK